MELKVCADHIDLILAKNRKDTKVLFETEHSIVLLDENMPCLFVSCTNFSEIQELLKSIDLSKRYTMAVHQKELASFFPDWEVYLECVNLLYLGNPPERTQSIYPIRRLNREDVRQASQLYRNMDDNAYVRHCIEKEVCYGMFDEDCLVAMIGEHDEEMIGLLHVHPDYRRRHLALILERFMMHVQHQKGKWIASQIQVDNEASFQLHKKLGFTKGKETIAWLRHRKRNV